MQATKIIRKVRERLAAIATGRLASAAMWNGIALLLARGLPVIGMMMAARILGREQFGQLGILYSTVMMLHVFAVASLGMMATTYIARWRDNDKDRTGSIIRLCYGFSICSGLVFLLAVLGLSNWIGNTVLGMQDAGNDVKVAGFLLLIVTIQAVQSGILMGFESFKEMAVANAIGGLASVVFLATGAFYGGVSGALWGLSIALILQNLVCHVILARIKRSFAIGPGTGLSKSDLHLLWTFGLPGLLTLAIWTVPTWGTQVFLVRQPNGLAEMGLLAAANQWFAALMFVPRVLTQVLLPIYSNRLAESDANKHDKLALQSGHMIALVSIPVAGIMVLFAPFIASLYGPEFASDYSVFAIMFVAAAAAAPAGALTNFLVAKEFMWSRLGINIIWAVILIGLAILLVKYGAQGIAIAALIAYACRSVMTYVFVRIIS